uniref:CN hydrolase domain-containing protein n=1 Tax=Paramoeba aestuarina TaxID=180227 RepID=A0A7S4KP86_9EUKA|mmetsp:Transcript_22626/g.35206  ORF Transcript_22626/g.35206 Transcript_22626/m.35206 type:complete len:516 (+) Transcript_22626:32-1579(+)
MKPLLVLLLFYAVVGSHGRESYRGAVVEMWPVPGHNQTDAGEVLSSNLDQVKYWTEQAKNNAAEIVVFPEDALYNFLFFKTRDDILPYLSIIPEKGTLLCSSSFSFSSSSSSSSSSPLLPLDQYNVLQTLGCVAEENGVVVVIDIGEVVYCSHEEENCPADGRWQYNIQVAIDEEGMLIGHYRKYHLFPEDYVVFDQPILMKDFEFFTTSFGVKFGQFICFDLFFRTPQWVLKDIGIQDFTFSTYWVNDGSMPPIPSVSLQQGFSRAAGTQLLASNIGLGKFDSGSGIYSKGEPLQERLNPNPDRPDEFLLVADIPIQPQPQQPQHPQHPQHSQQPQQQQHKRQQHGDNESFPSSYNIDELFSFSPGQEWQQTLIDGPTSCHLHLKVAENSPETNETFAFVAINGTLFDGLLPTQMCNYYVCTGSVSNTPDGWWGCSLFPLSSTTIFEYVNLTMTGIQRVGRPIPTAYASEGKLFSYHEKEIVFDYEENDTQATVSINGPTNLVAVGLHSEWIGI